MSKSYRPNQTQASRATEKDNAASQNQYPADQGAMNQTQTIQPTVLQQGLKRPQVIQPETMLQLQRHYGNRAVSQLIARLRPEPANTPNGAQPVSSSPAAIQARPTPELARTLQHTHSIQRVINMKFFADVGLLAGQTSPRNIMYKEIRDTFKKYQEVSKKADKISQKTDKSTKYKNLLREEYNLLKDMKLKSADWIDIHINRVPVNEQLPYAKKTQDLETLLNNINRELMDPKFVEAKSGRYLEKISEYRNAAKNAYIDATGMNIIQDRYEKALEAQKYRKLETMKFMLGVMDMDEAPLVKNFDLYVANLKQRTEMLNKLTPGERAAITTYTNHQFQLMNPVMAGDQQWFESNLKGGEFAGDAADPGRAKKANKKINKMAHSGLNKLPNWVQDQPIYRGDTFPEKEVKDFLGEKKKTYPHFVSTSLETNIPESYARGKRTKTRNTGIVWHIMGSKNGKNIIDLAKISSEKEILFPPNTTFVIDGVISQKTDNSGVIMELKVHEG